MNNKEEGSIDDILNESLSAIEGHNPSDNSISITQTGNGEIRINKDGVNCTEVTLDYNQKLLHSTQEFAKKSIDLYKALIQVKDEEIENLKNEIKILLAEIKRLEKTKGES